MTGPIELGADLPDFGGQIIVVIDERVLAKRATLGCPGQNHRPNARTEGRDLAVIILADGNRLELLDRVECALDVGRVLRVVGGACPVLRTPLRGCPVFGEGLIGRRPRKCLCECGAGAGDDDRTGEDGMSHGKIPPLGFWTLAYTQLHAASGCAS